ncbi:MAG TPA: hypothetical protein VES68_03545 [Candidatus Sulfotelmatobacter sp.]|nr:hypothetical protein [Candidatus Sulfotelmatobacter sp.]
MERRTGSQVPELPNGMTLDDLRFVNPQVFHLDMAIKGWDVYLGRGIDGNEAKVSYELSREVPKDFNFGGLGSKIGIVDEEGNVLPEYSVLHTNPPEKPSTLTFNFTGFPTQKTMDVLKKLEDEFSPPQFRPRHLRLVGESEGQEPEKRKSLLDRAKEIFHR